MEDSTRDNNRPHHKRTTTSVLKSIIAPRHHRRNQSAGDSLGQIYDENQDARPSDGPFKRTTPLTSTEIPYSYGGPSPLGELVQNQLGDRGQSKHLPWGYTSMEPPPPGSRPSTQQQMKANGPSREKLMKGKEVRKTKDDKEKPMTPKKSKSHTSLGALLSRPQSSKGLLSNGAEEERFKNERSVKQQPQQGPSGQQQQQQQQQQRPPTSAAAAPPPPIYAQFASQMTSIPLNDADLKAEISRYTPIDYSPSKQRIFHEYERPTLGKRGGAGAKSRPKSEYLTSSTTGTVLGDAMQALRRGSGDSDRAGKLGQQGDVMPEQKRRPQSFWGGRGGEKSDEVMRKSGEDQNQPQGLTVAKRGSRVMAAVAAFNMKSKDTGNKAGKNEPTKATTEAIESSFEALLDSRNVPQNMRQKLRSLDIRIKADFVKQDQAGNQTALPGATISQSVPVGDDSAVADHNRPTSKTEGVKDGSNKTSNTRTTEPGSPRKRGRPRSKTFSLHRSEKDGGGEGSLKKQKSGDDNNSNNHNRNGSPQIKSAEYQNQLQQRSTAGSSSKSLTSHIAADAMTLGFGNRHHAQPPVPQDFVKYLQKVQKPQEVDVKRLHKLRLVLRNERVAWVDSFITMGGMMEVVGLLRRIMKVEWREEHEDSLLHEVLLCLKALCTTKLALQELDTIQSSLFPELLAMIFDEEHKGPSEFTTRGIIFSLLPSLGTTEERNELRYELRISGFEKVMGGSLRTCKEKFYGAVHDGLRTWVCAAAEDGWMVDDVRRGPVVEKSGSGGRSSPAKSAAAGGSPKKVGGEAPKVELPPLLLAGGDGENVGVSGMLMMNEKKEEEEGRDGNGGKGIVDDSWVY
ncbi:MAG: hypothetical protein M1823_003551 [Watsoniomyces obsoletus]|nr:MAG: hypothetical protein M1823_003551 [Watsoniomyces obsoletus]